MIDLRFTYLTGQKRPVFRNARLAGSWNGWIDIPMTEIVAEDGCPAFTALIPFDDGQAGQRVQVGACGWTGRPAPTHGASRRTSSNASASSSCPVLPPALRRATT